MSLRVLKPLPLMMVLLGFTGYTHAEWSVQVHVDAFSKEETVKLIGTFEGQSGVMFECQKQKLMVHFLERDDDFRIGPGGQVRGVMAIRVDNHAPVVFQEAGLYRHTPDYISVRSGDEEKIRETLTLLRTAKIKVIAGVKIPSGVNISRRGDFHYATRTVKTFERKCGIKI